MKTKLNSMEAAPSFKWILLATDNAAKDGFFLMTGWKMCGIWYRGSYEPIEDKLLGWIDLPGVEL